MSHSFSTSSDFFIVSWRSNNQNLSVYVGDFVKAMNLYFGLKVNRPRIWYFPGDGRKPKMIRREL